jgi:hypothetical protein
VDASKPGAFSLPLSHDNRNTGPKHKNRLGDPWQLELVCKGVGWSEKGEKNAFKIGLASRLFAALRLSPYRREYPSHFFSWADWFNHNDNTEF